MPANDLGRDYRAERQDRAEEQSQTAYDAAYARIEAALIAGAIADGADADYKPSGADVHRLVTIMLHRGE